MKKLLKFIKSLFKKLKGVKSTKPILSNINLLLIRDTFTDESTIGELFLNGERMCDTLELPYRDNQRSISCIPNGEYKVRLRYPRESATRDYLHLLVQDVKDRSYILFHKTMTVSACFTNFACFPFVHIPLEPDPQNGERGQ